MMLIVLADPHLLYAAHTADANTDLINGQTFLSTIGDDYVVYVNNIDDPTAIVGYRNNDGDTWYNAEGLQISLDPTFS